MKIVILLLFSPLLVSSFASLCPQQPNSVVVNCNNQNPYGTPIYTTNPLIPGRITGRVLDIGYNKPPVGSKLQLQLQRSDSSEESSESDESSEEINDHRIPLTVITHPQIPSFHTTVNNRLDFLNSLRRVGAGVNNLRSIPRNHIPSHVVSTSEHLGTSTGTGVLEVARPDQTIVVDETHGHGHSGHYNHGQGHEHGHHHGHEHGPMHNRGHEHMHDHMNGQIPSHILIPTHITRPTTTISGAHIIPEHIVPIGQLLSSGLGNVVIDDPAHLLFGRDDPRINGATFQVAGVNPISVPATGQYNPTLDLTHDTHDRLVLTRRGYRALGNPLTTIGTYELYPQDLLNRIITTISIPSVVQNGFNTEINCDSIPLVSEIPKPEVAQGPVIHTMLPTTSTSEDKVTSMLPSWIMPTETVNGPTRIPLPQEESTVTKVTTTKVEERPTGGAITNGMPVQTASTVTKVTTTKVDERPASQTFVQGTPSETSSSSSSTVTKVTTTKVEGRPTTSDMVYPSETIMYEKPTNEMGSTVTKVTTTKVEGRPTTSGMVYPSETIMYEKPTNEMSSTVTKVTTTKVDGVPVTTDVVNPSETIMYETPTQIGSTVTKVTTTKIDGVPVTTGVVNPSETIMYETPTQMGSTITKVTTTKIDGRPVTTDVIIPTETVVRETPAETGSTITKVTTTKVEERPVETIVHEAPVRTGSTVTKVTTTEYRPNDQINDIRRKIETMVPNPVGGDVVDATKGVEEFINVETSPLMRLVRPVRDGTHRYDSYRQRMGPLVYHV